MVVVRFDWEQFRVWALAEYGMADRTVYYYSSRIRAMVRLGLDLEACMDDPRTLRRQGNQVIANSKLPKVVKGRVKPASGHVTRNFQRALNWLSDYGQHLERESLRYQLGRDVDDEDLDDRVRRWKKWELHPEPASMPKSVDTPDLGIFRTYCHRACNAMCRRNQPAGRAHCYTTYLRRAIADVAFAGNFRRGEMEQIEKGGLFPHLGKIRLGHAMKGSVSGDVDVPWSLYHPESGLLQFLQVRVDVEGSDALFTVPPGHGHAEPRALGGAAIYVHLHEMGKELGVPINLVRTKRRALSDIDEANVNPRVIQAKGRHVKLENTMTYLGQVTSSRQRRELAEHGIPGYSDEDAVRVVDLSGRPVFATAIGSPGVAASGARDDAAPVQPQAADVHGAPPAAGMGASVEGGGPAGRGHRGGLLPSSGRGGEARQELRQRDGRAQRPGPVAPAATRGLSCPACGSLLGGDVVGRLLQGVTDGIERAGDGTALLGAAMRASQHEQSGADAEQRPKEKDGRPEFQGVVHPVVGLGTKLLDQVRRQRGKEIHARRANTDGLGLPEVFGDLPTEASSLSRIAPLEPRRNLRNPAALYGAQGLPQPAQADALERVVPGQQESAVRAADPALYLDLGDTTPMHTTPVLMKKGSLGLAEPITFASPEWRPTGAVRAAPAGLPAAGIQALNSADTTKAEERTFTRKPGVAPTGATGEGRTSTRLPGVRAATPAEMQVRRARPFPSPSSTSRRPDMEVVA